MFAESSSVIYKPYWQRVKEVEDRIAQERAAILADNGTNEPVEAALKDLNAKRTRLLRGIWWNLYFGSGS